jgi:hypothetical protein
MSEHNLSDFCTPILLGLTPEPESEMHRFRLDPDLAAELQKRLEELRESRARAMISAQNYYIR